MAEKPNQEQTIRSVIAARRARLARRSELLLLFRCVILLGLAGWILFTRVFMLVRVEGIDMFPSMKDGDLAVIFRLHQEYETEDVIAYQVDGALYIGRIAARAGDVVTIDSEEGKLTVNGTVKSGEIMYPTYAREGSVYPERVPEGCVYVLGDYRTQSRDSRDFGPIPMRDVKGKVITLLRRRGL